MAYNKKYAELDESVIDYVNNREDAIEQGFDATEIQSGSNSNGSWTKFPDGTMICTKRVEFSNVTTELTWGGLIYTQPIQLGELPVNFIAPPIMSYNFYPSTTTWAWVMSITNAITSSSSAGEVVLVRPTTGTINGVIEVTAIGRWK